MADITVTKNPNTYELATGKVIVSLYDLDESLNTRMAIRVKDIDDNVIGDLRQLPNASGYCHFDISRILRSKVSSNPSLEPMPNLADGEYEIIQYYYEYGYVPFDGTFIVEGQSPVLYAINGRKPYTLIDWDFTPYLPLISYQTSPITFNRVDSFQRALTDRVFTEVTGADITAKPAWVANTTPVSIGSIRKGNDYTLSFINGWIPNPIVGNWTNGINAIRIAVYNGNLQLVDTNINNVIGSGGGPSSIFGDEADVTGKYRLITTQAGNANAVIAAYPQATHYYVAASTLFRDPDISFQLTTCSRVYRFEIEDGECNDFDNIQVSWLNSLGGRDYFDFQKRNDVAINTNRNTYHQLDADWSAPSIEVNSYNRGQRVYSQSHTTEYTAATRYLTDDESQYLKNLYISPDVRVKINGGEWQPVVLTSNGWTERTFRKDQMFQHQITFNISNSIQTQQG